jgi:hypothetical protein
MAWTPFPYPDPAYRTRRKVWRACGPLHAGDREPFP